MLNMLNFFGSMGGQTGPNRGKIIQHIQHIQHFSRKKHFFGKRHSTWSNIFNISAERSTFLKKELVSGKNQHNPKSGSFSRKNSTWPKSGSFSRKDSTCADNVFLSYEKFLFRCFSVFFSSLSLSLSLSRSLSLCTSDPFFFCTSPLVCLSLSLTLSLSLSLSLSPFLSLSIVTHSLCSSTFLHYTLSFLLAFSVLGCDLGSGLGSTPKPKLGCRVLPWD